MAVLLSVVFGLLVYPIHITGLTLCDTDGTLEVVENTASNVFTCTGADSAGTIGWILQRSNGNIDLATCTPDSCNNPYKPQFEASRPADDRSTLTVNGSTTSYFQYIQGQTIVCRTHPPPGSPQQTQCTVDVVAVPSVTCDARYNTGTSSPWTVTVNCSVSGAYSYLNRYTCNLTQTSPTTKSLGSGNLVVTSTSGSGGKYKTGYCQVTVPYPNVTGAYSYKMAVTPGRQDVPASFGGQSSFEIKRPSTPPSQYCPQYVRESRGTSCTCTATDLGQCVCVERPSTPPSHNCPQYVGGSQGTSCTCTATDLGQPAGVVRWTSTRTNQLSLNVIKNDNGTTYTCEVIWDGHRTQSVTYTLQVAYGPISVSITHPPFPYDTNGQQQLNLTCSASDADPAPTFTWVKGSANNVVGQGRTYTFRPQPPGDDNSVFVCRAVNMITNTRQQDSTILTLNYPPTQNPVITITPTPSNSGGHLYQGDRVTLTCAVTGGKPFGATTVTFTCPGKQDSPDTVGTSGVTSTVTFDSLTAADHDKVCTCTTSWKNTNWYSKNETTKLYVSYKPSISSFTVNSSSATILHVNAGDVFNLSCQATGRPPPEVKLFHPDQSLVAMVPPGSPYVADRPSVVNDEVTAQCRDTGIYICIAGSSAGIAQQQTVLMYVQCSPQLAQDVASDEIPYVNFDTDAAHLNFDVIGYPTPRLRTVRYFPQPPGDVSDGQPVPQFQVDVTCTTSGMTSSMVACLVTVDNITASGFGFYQAVVGNDFGDLSLTFEVRGKTPSAGASGGISTGAAVGIVAAVMAVLFSVVIVVFFVWLWRREWVLPCAEANRVHKDGGMEQGGRPDMSQFNDQRSPGDAGVYELTDTGEPSSARQQQQQPPQFNDQRSQQDAGVYELQDTGEPNTPNVTDPYTTPSHYDSLQTSDMGLRSVYTSLLSPGYQAGAAGDTGPPYVNNSETGPVYVNKDNAKTDPVNVNKENSKTDPVYVNKDSM